MELLLWRWSNTVQLTSLVMIALFFAVLARSVRLSELRWWVLAWAANLCALGVSLFFWYVQPAEVWFPLLRTLYMGPKTAFVLLLMQGAWALKRPGAALLGPWQVAAAATVYPLAAFWVTSIPMLGATQHVVMGALFALGGLLLLRRPIESGLRWLAAGFLTRAVLSLSEAGAYVMQLVPAEAIASDLREKVGTFLAAHSSFDSAAEWLLALGCVLALSERVQRELRQYNQDLLAAQEDLRRLADRDPLTGLANRRSLPEIFRAVHPVGATLLFFDIDDFKQINDLHGHQAGDECLRRFAIALGDCFRPSDGLVRYGGDEFLAVARGLDRTALPERIERLRERLRSAQRNGPVLSFSVGVSELPAGGRPEEALRAADESMYEAKAARNAPRRFLVEAAGRTR